MATKHWRLLGARSQGEVHGFYVAQLRRRMGVTAVREFARHRLRRAAYVGVPRAVVEQMMQQEAMRVRLHGQPAAEPPYADFFAWAGQQPAAARGTFTRRPRARANNFEACTLVRVLVFVHECTCSSVSVLMCVY